MADIIDFPSSISMETRPKDEFYKKAESNDDAVWRACLYLRAARSRNVQRKKCPHTFEDERRGICHRGCRMMAEELVAVILEEFDNIDN